MKKHIIYFGFSTLLLTSCGGGNGEETTQEEDSVKVEICTYSYDETSTVLTWTAFKHTDKIAVNGTFNEINVTANDGSEEMMAVLNGSTFSIPVASINSQDEVRDGKIKNSFFGNMESTELLSGKVNSIDESQANVTVTMNGVSVDYEGGVEVEGETVTMSTTIDILDFNGQTAIDSLNVVCAEKHTGEDGVQKFWSEVDVVVKTTLTKECK